MSEIQNVFAAIYRKHSWGSDSRSGPGSVPARTVRYREVVARVLHNYPISSVVDVGCGDWASSKYIDWGNVDYTGVDIVPALVDHLNAEFALESRRFILANLVEDELPVADLCIIKDVLQHLSNDSVHRFLRQQLPRYRFALITNDARRTPLFNLLRPWRLRKANIDTHDGGLRPLRLTKSPFSLPADRLAWLCMLDWLTVVEKEVLLWKRATK